MENTIKGSTSIYEYVILREGVVKHRPKGSIVAYSYVHVLLKYKN